MMIAEVVEGRCYKLFLFCCRHRFFGRSESVPRLAAYLDKNNIVTMAGNQVYLAVAAAVISFKDAVTFLFQCLAGNLLPSFSRFLFLHISLARSLRGE